MSTERSAANDRRENDIQGFASLAELQAAHVALVEQPPVSSPEEAAKEITKLIRRAALTGKCLDRPDDRLAAQGLINFWVVRQSAARRAARKWSGGSDEPSIEQTDNEFLACTILAPFDDATIQRAMERADRLIEDGKVDGNLAKRLLMRLLRLQPTGEKFDAAPTVRSALWDIAAPDNVDAAISLFTNAGVVRVVPGKSSELDRVSLRSDSMIGKWARLQPWKQERLNFRNVVNEWLRESRAAKFLLPTERLEDARYYIDRNLDEREFLDACRKEVGRDEGLKLGRHEGLELGRSEGRDLGRRDEQRESALRTLEKLKLREAAESFNPFNRTTFMGAKETALAEEWRDRLQGDERNLATNKINAFIDQSRFRLTNRELSRKRRQVLLLATLCVCVVGWAYKSNVAFVKEKKAREFEAKATETEKIARHQAVELHDANEQRHRILEATPLIASNPGAHLKRSLNALRSADAISELPVESDSPEKCAFTEELLSVYRQIGNDATLYLNLSLHACVGSNRLDNPSNSESKSQKEPEYIVNSVAVCPSLSLVATGSHDGVIRLWSISADGKRLPRLVRRLGEKRPNTETAAISGLAFGGADGKTLAAACGKNGIALWMHPHGESQPIRLATASDSRIWNQVAWCAKRRNILAAVASPVDGEGRARKTAANLVSWDFDDRKLSAIEIPIDGIDDSHFTALTFEADPTGTKFQPSNNQSAGISIRLFATKKDESAPYAWNLSRTTTGYSWKPDLTFHQSAAKHDKKTFVWRITAGFLRESRDDSETEAGGREILFGAGDNGTAAIWNLTPPKPNDQKASEPAAFQAGELILMLQHPCPVRGVAIARNGALLATAGRDAKVRLWPIYGHRIEQLGPRAQWSAYDPDVRSLNGHVAKLTDLTFATLPDGGGRTLLASSGDEQTTWIWKPLPEEGPCELFGLSDFAYFCFSPNLELTAACDREPKRNLPFPVIRRLNSKVRQFESVNPFAAIATTHPAIRRVAFHPDGQRLATLDAKGTLKIWRSENVPSKTAKSGATQSFVAWDQFEIPRPRPEGKIKDNLELLPPVYGRIAFGKVGRFLAYTLTEKDLWVLPIEKNAGKRLTAYYSRSPGNLMSGDGMGKEWAIYGCAMHEEAGPSKEKWKLAIACSEGKIVVVDSSATTKEILLSLPKDLGSAAVNSVAFSDDGRWVVGGYADAKVVIWDISKVSPTSYVLGGKAGKDNKDDGDSLTSNERRGHASEVKCISVRTVEGSDSNEIEIASGGDDGLLIVWSEVEPGTFKPKFVVDCEAPIHSLRYDATRNRIAVANAKGHIQTFWFDRDELKKVAKESLEQLDFGNNDAERLK